MFLRSLLAVFSVLLSMLVVSQVAADDDDILDYLPAILIKKAPSPSAPPAPGDNADFVSQVVPWFMALDSTYTVRVTMRNTGATTWDAEQGYFLQSQYPVRNRNFGIAEVPLPTKVLPGAEVTFVFNVGLTQETYLNDGRRFAWGMAKAGVNFGQGTPVLVPQVGPREINDTPPPAAPPSARPNSPLPYDQPPPADPI